MSCLSLRLPPAKKAWRSFTSKLQTRLHKLQTSKPFKKSKSKTRLDYPIMTPATAKLVRSSFLHDQQKYLQRKKCLTPPPPPPLSFLRRRIGRRSLIFHKKPAPVYIDKLFKEAAVPVVECVKVKQQPNSKNGTINVKVVDSAEDDSIDKRAEVFIARFRADMELQEKLARSSDHHQLFVPQT